jgi:hypothetical protein
VLVVAASTGWNPAWVAAARQRLAQLASKSAFLTVVFMADAKSGKMSGEVLDTGGSEGIREITLRPWHDAAVRQWLADLGVPSDRALRELIRDATGNWPSLLGRLKGATAAEMMQGCEALWQETTVAAEQEIRLGMFALANESVSAPLRIAADLGQFSIDEVCEFLGDRGEAARQTAEAVIAWAERLALVTPGAGGRLVFDPVAARIARGGLPA